MSLSPEQAEAIIKPIHGAYDAALAKADMRAVGKFYAQDGVFIVKGEGAAHGRDEIREELKPFSGPSDTTNSDEVYEATTNHIVYRASFTSSDKSRGTVEQIWRKEDGKWLIIYDEYDFSKIGSTKAASSSKSWKWRSSSDSDDDDDDEGTFELGRHLKDAIGELLK